MLVIGLDTGDTGSEREGFSICHEPYHICGTGWHITVSQMSVEDGDRQRTVKRSVWHVPFTVLSSGLCRVVSSLPSPSQDASDQAPGAAGHGHAVCGDVNS